jgi:heme exporter protein C
MLSYFSNPERFDRLARALIPWTGGLAAVLIAAGIIWIFGFLPQDYQQDWTIRILYIHVPSAVIGMGLYAGLAIASFVYFVWRHALADAAAEVMAPIGAVYTALMLASGSIWGRPTWGTWWEWDGRMTSALVLLLLYLGYMALRAAIEDPRQGARAASILGMAGAINLPIIKWSVEWWSGVHQGASITFETTETLDPRGHAACVQDQCIQSMIYPTQLPPLFLMMAGVSLLAAWMVLYRMRTMRMERRADALQRRREAGA